jgi:hypothetical protein
LSASRLLATALEFGVVDNVGLVESLEGV